MDSAGFWSRVSKTDDCWLWLGSKTKRGYGLVYVGAGRRLYAHRFAWECEKGPISDDLGLDHKTTCPKNCVRPDHLRPVTAKQNQENRINRTRSKTGIRGVYPNKMGFMARVRHNGKDIYVGNYPTVEQAELAVIAKRLELFTHNDTDREQLPGSFLLHQVHTDTREVT